MPIRLKAFGLHMLLSMTLITVYLTFVFFVWYQDPYYKIYDTWAAIKIVVGVDLIIGPLLTLIVFDIAKKRSVLVRDIAVIIIVQISALSWGVHVTYSVRPLFSVFHEGTFYLFSQQDVDVSRMADKTLIPAFWQSATYVYVNPPKDKDEYNHIYANLIDANERPDVMYLTERYLPLNEIREKVNESAINLTNALNNNDKKQMVDNFLKDRKTTINECSFYSIKGGNKHASIVFDKQNGLKIGYIDAILEY